MAETLDNPASRYSRMDRLWHRLAFSMIDMQVDLAKRDLRQHQADLMGIQPKPPVFIAALPRAGTTLLLDVLVKDTSFASHTYRDMPALFCPLTWRNFSARFRHAETLSDRAHGDGMRIGYDSAEAFEEALWLHFWPDHFEPDGTTIWAPTESNQEFEDFFDSHMRMIILNARSQSAPEAERYISKNNGNVARTGWMRRMYPAATILVPFRHPAAHVASLLRQHKNFEALHQRDGFAKKYMADIGHFEFGSLHRPVRFDGLKPHPAETPAHAAYWTRYWIAAYRYLLDRPNGEIALVDFDALCESPGTRLRAVAELLNLHRPGLVTGEAHRFRQPQQTDWSSLDVPDDLQQEADRIFSALRSARAV